MQEEQAIKPKYLVGREVTGNMRAILIDWLVQVQMKFRLLQETMYMTVSIIDRFMQVSGAPGALPATGTVNGLATMGLAVS